MSSPTLAYTVELDRTPGAGQDQETFVVRRPGEPDERIRLHDYDRVFAVPGLYEEVLQHQLECASPAVIVSRLRDAVLAAGLAPDGVRVLDVGAGNGVIGEELRDAGLHVPVAVDALVEARDAAERDRPGLYAEYVIDDGTPQALDGIGAAVRRHELNALTCAAALGPDHIPIERLIDVWGRMPAGAFIALTAPSDLVDDWGGAQQALNAVSTDDAPTTVVHAERFRHRLLMDGSSVDYDVLVGRKPS
jgi:hypothetical protein